MSLQLQEQQPQKSSLLPRGCRIALIISGVLTVIFLLLLGIGVYAISQNPEVRRVARVVGGAMRIMGEAANAPGTTELRAIGCDRAMVFDTDRLDELARELEDDDLPAGSDPEVRLVVCQHLNNGPPPQCDDAARTYVRAVPSQPGPFSVMVQNIQQQQTQCMSRYAADGQLLQRMSTNSGPNLPTAPIGQ